MFHIITKLSLSFVIMLSVAAMFVMPVLLGPSTSYAFKLKIAWDPNPPEEEVVGYRLYYSTESCDGSLSCVYQSRSPLIKASRCSDVICEYKYSRLAKGLTYYLALVAQNAYGLESNFSGEISVNTCEYSVGPKKKKFRAEGGSGALKIKTQPDCEWSVQSPPSWVKLSSQANGKGQAVVDYTVSPNPGLEARVAVFTIKSKTFTITQSGQ